MRRGLIIACLATGLMPDLATNALAQITPDTTLGSETTRITPGVALGDGLIDRIDGGAIRSNALFHSFFDFNVNDGQQVYFSNPVFIDNIFSRVTGANASQIFGRLGVLGNANLYLINPNGILFGPNAQLDVRGTFVGSTAAGLILDNGNVFSAVNPEAPPLLVLNAPLGLSSWLPTAAPIASSGTLSAGQDLMLLGTALDLTGQLQAGRDLTLIATDSLTAGDTAVQPFIVSAGNNLQLQGNRALTINALDHPDSGLFSGADMVLRSDQPVLGDALYFTSGNFRIERVDGSPGRLTSPEDPVVRASGDVSFESYEGASLHILAGGSVNIGGIAITGPDTAGNSIQEQVTLSNGAILNIDGSAEPTVDIRAGTLAVGTPGLTPAAPVDFVPGPPDTASPGTGADINIGFIDNPGGRVLLTNQYQPAPGVTGDITVSEILTADFAGGGDVAIDSSGGITFDFINVSGEDPITFDIGGNSGSVTLLAGGELSMPFPSFIFSYGIDTGNILLESDTAIVQADAPFGTDPFELSFIDSQNRGSNPGGEIRLIAPAVSIGGNIVATTFGEGESGNIAIEANNNLRMNQASVFTDTQGDGNSGNVTVNAGEILLDFTFLGTTTSSFGTIPDQGNGGALNINANNLTLTREAFIGSFIQNAGIGNAGAVTINAQNAITLDALTQIISSSEADTQGNSGSIGINTGTLSLADGALVISSVFGTGNAGQIDVVARDSVTIDGAADIEIPSAIASEVFTDAVGQGGDINLVTPVLRVTNGGTITASTNGDGNAGNVNITAAQSATFDGIGPFDRVSSAGVIVDESATGTAGTLSITTPALLVANGAQLRAETLGAGNAGNIVLNVNDQVLVEGAESAIRANVAPGSTGAGGSVIIDSSGVLVQNNGRITVSTQGPGDGGNLQITSGQLQLLQGGQLTATAESSGNAGSIKLATRDTVLVDGNNSAILANTTVDSTGQGGSINIDPQLVLVQNGGRIAVDSQGTGTGGDITLTANELRLLNQGLITAETASTDGGNITLNLGPLLLLRTGSNISATAGTAQSFGNGGNVTINIPDGFIVAVPAENSNISANAFLGNGGNVNITTQGIFGIEFQPAPTPLSDITASSEFGLQGTVTIETPDVDPSKDLVNLPETVVDASRLVAQNCGAGTGVASTLGEFVVTGRGGLPPSPTEQLSAQSNLSTWETLEEAADTTETTAAANPAATAVPAAPTQIVEFQGWVVDEQGNIVLTAEALTATPHAPWAPAATCQAQQG